MQGLAGFMTSLDQGGDVKCPKNIKKAEGGLEVGGKKTGGFLFSMDDAVLGFLQQVNFSLEIGW